MLVNAAGHHSSGEKEPGTEPEPMTYALTWSFSHASYGIGHAPLSPITHPNFITRMAVTLH